MRTYPLVDASALTSWNNTLRKLEKGKLLLLKDFVAFMSIHRVNVERCTCPTYGTYVMCEGILLWHIVKVPRFKVPTQYSWELIAQRPFQLGRVERLVTTRAERPKQSSSKKARKKGVKRRGPRSNTDGATSHASKDAMVVPLKGDSALHRKAWHRLNLFRTPWTCGQCKRKVLWCMHCKGCGFA